MSGYTFDDVSIAITEKIPPTVGYFASDVANKEDPAWVILPGFSKTKSWGPAFWAVREIETAKADSGGNVTVTSYLKPKRLNPCLVVMDDEGRAWVVLWWPYTTVVV